jgi:peptide/nickel transport system substrate-binding protein
MRRRRFIGVTGAAGAAAFLAACGGSKQSDDGGAAAINSSVATSSAGTGAGETPKPGGSAAARITATAPLDVVGNATVATHTAASLVFSRLLKFKTDNNPATASNYETAPDMASGYEATADGLQFTFKLKQAKFHNKPPINGRLADSEDVKVSLERFRAEPKNTNRNVFGTAQNPIVDRVETPDQQTVVFKLARPFGPFLSLVATAQYLWIQPKELANNAYDPTRDQIGTGPWLFDSVQPDIELKYRKHPEFFVPNRPYIDEFHYIIAPDNLQEIAQFQAKRLDTADIPYESVQDVKRTNPDAAVVSYPGSTLPFLSAQQRSDSVFKDERVRRALSLAVDREGLLKLSYDGQGVWQNMVPSSFGKWHVDPRDQANAEAARWFKFDVKEAVALLKAAGYDENNKLNFKYYYTPNGYTQRYNQWAETVAGMLKETKVLNPAITPADYLGEWIKSGGIFFGAYDGVAFMLQSGFIDPHDYLFNPMYFSSPRNHAGIGDPQLDALIDKEQAAISQDARVKLVHEIQRYNMDKMYYAPTMYGPTYIFQQPWVRDYHARRGYGAGAETWLDMWLNR